VVLGNTLTDDPFPDQHFDYLLANPPFGVDWKAEKEDHRSLAQLPRLQRQAAAHQRRRAAVPALHDEQVRGLRSGQP
jgi:type I restriction-modification system DNA methylase subunit